MTPTIHFKALTNRHEDIMSVFVNKASFMRHILFRSLHQAHGSLRIIDNQHTNNNAADVRQMINWGVGAYG